MIIKYNIEIEKDIVENNLQKIINQVYKLLPNREENLDWKKPLLTIIEELSGMDRLIKHGEFFSLLCKLEGLFLLTDEKDFFLYRRTILECLGILNKIMEDI